MFLDSILINLDGKIFKQVIVTCPSKFVPLHSSTFHLRNRPTMFLGIGKHDIMSIGEKGLYIYSKTQKNHAKCFSNRLRVLTGG